MMSSAATIPRAAKWRVLIFPGGTEIGLELRQALAWNKDIQLFSAGAAVSSHATCVFERHFAVPPVSDPAWVARLQEVVSAEGITHIFPAHDDVVLALAEQGASLSARVVSSPLLTCRIARSKRQTLEALRGHVPVPRLFPSVAGVERFPVFVKPDVGQGSYNAARAESPGELANLLAQDPSRLILEHLEGPEYTVDCFSDRVEGLLYASGRQRIRIRSGIAMRSSCVEDDRFLEYAQRIGKVLTFHGAWFFQVKADGAGELKLLEVAPRIGGTSGLSRARGVNLPLLSLFEAERIPVVIKASAREVSIDRALVNRFQPIPSYSALYLDLDDTLILRGRVNPEVIKLLFQSLNRGVKVVLLTRHAGDLGETLRRFRLEGLFDEIVHIRDGRRKGDFIREADAILVDDSFAERAAVQAQTGIAVYDPSMVEALTDDRV